MILIFSILNDYSTKNVIEWLDFYGESFIRLNYDNNDDVIDIVSWNLNSSIEDTVLTIKDKKVKLRDIKFIWHRRGGYRLKNFIKGSSSISDRSFKESLAYYYSAYSNTKFELLSYLFQRVPSLGRHNGSRINKIIVLEKAIRIGLKVPDSKLVSEKKSLLKIDNDSENLLINKSLDLAFTHFDKKKSKSIMSYTSLVDKQFINDSLPDQFGLSLIQSQIVKEYEIRVFFIGDKFFSTAILSQNDNKTALDYRRYNKDLST